MIFYSFLFIKNRFEIYNLQFKSDGMTRRLSVDGPHPGNWFAVAFITWTDPNNDRIEQQGKQFYLNALRLPSTFKWS